MKPIDELTMHAYGLLEDSEEEAVMRHVDGCADCAETVRRLRTEHATIARAARPAAREPAPAAFLDRLAKARRPGRRRGGITASGLAAAAILLAGLAWLLLQRPMPGLPVNSAALAPNDPLDRLIAELRSPSKERREIAEDALRAFGEPAVARLEKEGFETLRFRGPGAQTAEDTKVQKLINFTRVTIDQQNVSIKSIANYFSSVLGRPVVFDRIALPDPDQERISFKVQDIALDGALRLMLGPRNHRYEVRGGGLYITSAETEPGAGYGAAPVRVMRDSAEAPALVAALASESYADREKAEAALRRLGFAAEGALWEGVENSDVEIRWRATKLLRRLYVPSPRRGASPFETRLRETPAASLQPQNFIRAAETVSDRYGISVAIDGSRPEVRQVADGGFFGTTVMMGLAQMAGAESLQVVGVDDLALIARFEDSIVTTSWDGPLWTTPKEARELEMMLADLASDDAARQVPAAEQLAKKGAAALHPLREAAELFPAAAGARCREIRRKILDQQGLWVVDEPSGAELQTPTDPWKARLSKTVSFAVREATLEQVLEKAGLKADVRAKTDRAFDLFAKNLKTSSLLKALTRPHGLDFYVEGDTLVIDKASKVRGIVEK